MSIYSASDSDDEKYIRSNRLLNRQRSIHSILGGGKVADTLLWRNPKESGAILGGVSLIWFLFQVVEYNFITLICHIAITSMLALFIWFTGADFFNWDRPTIPNVIIDESTFKRLASSFHVRFNKTLSKFLDVACGRDPGLFFLITFLLYILSVIGTYINFVNLVFLGYLCMQILPFLYDVYEEDADKLAYKLIRKLEKTYRLFEANVLNKIPRGVPAGKQKKLIR